MRSPMFWPVRGWFAWASHARIEFVMSMLERYCAHTSRSRSGPRMLSWGPLRGHDRALVLAFRARRARGVCGVAVDAAYDGEAS